MKVLQTHILRGPNYWSTRCSKLILVRLDLEELAHRSSDTLPGFYEGLAKILPSLEKHSCLPGCRGGFLSRMQKGTTMGHVLERVALELQTLADMPVGFGRTCETATTGVYQVAIEYQNEPAGRYAVRAALRLCHSILDTGTYPKAELKKDLNDLTRLRAEAALGASTDALVQEAETRGIPWTHLETCDLFQLGYGKYQKRVQASLTSHSNVLGVELAGNKESTKKILSNMGVPVPLGEVVYAFRELEDAIHRLGGYPIVIKPLDGNHGRGITIDIQTWRQAEVAYDRARDVSRDVSRDVIVEHFYQGRDHRILVVNHKVVAVAERVPAHVVGNGQATIWELVEQENQDSRRGEGHDNVLTHIELDRATDEMLRRQDYTLDTILPPDQICYLRATANLSTGGIAIDRTDEIHPHTVWLAERVSRIIDLDVVGLDVLTTDITKPLSEVNGVIVEVNAAPGLRMHVAPSQGVGRNVAVPILNMLFPPGTPTRIPVVAVTGTNSKATPTPLIAHIFSQVYDAVGFTTADEVYISDRILSVRPLKTGCTAAPQRAQIILQDPTVEAAILEIGQDEILHSGLAFQQCDVGVVLNVVADQLGVDDTPTVNQMARVNGVIAETVRSDGYAVLNADDAQVAAMAGRVVGKVAYFSMHLDNPVVRSHVQQGGMAAVYEKGSLSILQGDRVHQIEHVARIPIALGGCTPFMIANALAAGLTAFVLGVKVEQIRAALHCFQASAWQIPGEMPEQMKLFNLDYYHFNLLKQYSDFKDERVSIQGALRPQPALVQSNALYASTIALENELRHKNRNQTIVPEHPLREKVLNGGSQNAIEGYPTKQSVHYQNRPEAQTVLQDPPHEVTTVAPTRSEDRKVDIPTVETDRTELAHHIDRATQEQGLKAKNGAKERAVLMQVAFNRLQKIAEQAVDIGKIMGAVAIAVGGGVVDRVLGKVKAWGAIAWEKFGKATQLVDPVTLDPALENVIVRCGRDGWFANEWFIFQRTHTGVDVHLKDGTPVYTNGKLYPKVDGRFSFLLSKIPDNVAKLNADISQQLTAYHC
jgi:cyanophycin synthetase